HGIEQRHIDAAVRDCEFAPLKKPRTLALAGKAGIAAGLAAGVVLTLSLMLAWQSFGKAEAVDGSESASPVTNKALTRSTTETPADATRLQASATVHRTPVSQTLQESLQ